MCVCVCVFVCLCSLSLVSLSLSLSLSLSSFAGLHFIFGLILRLFVVQGAGDAPDTCLTLDHVYGYSSGGIPAEVGQP